MNIHIKILAVAFALMMMPLATSLTEVAGEERSPELPDGFQAMVRVPAPNVPFQAPDGTTVGLVQWRGKVVVLNLWATWCGPCVKEMPALDRLAGKLSSERIAIIAVSQDKGGRAVAAPFLDRLGITNLTGFADPVGKLGRELGVRGLPTTFIIAADGAMLGRLEGPAEWDSDSVAGPLRALAR